LAEGNRKALGGLLPKKPRPVFSFLAATAEARATTRNDQAGARPPEEAPQPGGKAAASLRRRAVAPHALRPALLSGGCVVWLHRPARAEAAPRPLACWIAAAFRPLPWSWSNDQRASAAGPSLRCGHPDHVIRTKAGPWCCRPRARAAPNPVRQPRLAMGPRSGFRFLQKAWRPGAWLAAEAAGGLTSRPTGPTSSGRTSGSGEVAPGWIPFPADRHSRSWAWFGLPAAAALSGGGGRHR